ncbi:hypothetical protein [Methylomicrobium sp. Wu6]|uniref:hypothetical protein n=1 Tax=Methylomicrobium sp. Wu6 TaxID=3107928 RepID=UPI002DD65CE2|nr:hypothetical protein [Methylomicrobium sp. Wu6]MEC4749587.1 hypothetical protein [Methylomicrobium sp. Wu6]
MKNISGLSYMPPVDKFQIESIKTITLKLLDYCNKNNWAGYDPYDALNSRIFEFLPFLNFRIPRLVLTQLLKRCPFNLRPLLQIPKTHNPKALGLFLMSFIKLSKLGLLVQEDLITKMVDELIAHRSQDSSYWCWGYSFPWQTRTILVPKGAPNLVCTVFVANALLDTFEFNNDKRCLEMAISAGDYILAELYRHEDDGKVYFSYPFPTMRIPVHNANLLAAALLTRLSRYTKEKNFLGPAIEAARYSASMQHNDGSWDYGESPKYRWIDNFHTGYNLCALKTLSKCIQSTEFDKSTRQGFDFFCNHFFRDDNAPKYFHDKVYPIDIHSVAQSIITLIDFKQYNENNLRLAYFVCEWAIEQMWNEKSGYFYFVDLPFWKNKISYMRWSQAWMLLALTYLLEDSYQAYISEQVI